MTALLLAAALALGQGRITNGASRNAGRGPVARARNRRGDLSRRRTVGRLPNQGRRGRPALDGLLRPLAASRSSRPTEVSILARYEGTTLTRLRTATPDCEIDAGGLPVTWLDNVKADDSAAWLTSIINEHAVNANATTASPNRPLSRSAMHEGSRRLTIAHRDRARSCGLEESDPTRSSGSSQRAGQPGGRRRSPKPSTAIRIPTSRSGRCSR